MVNNSLSNTANTKVIEYDCGGETVKLSPEIIRSYLVSGNGAVTDQEVVVFLNLCRFQHLNPFLKEAYLIKFGTQPATMVIGKEVFTKRAFANPKFAGHSAGVVVLKEDGTMENRVGTIVLRNEELIGGWAKVYLTGYIQPIEITASFDEYCLKRDGKPMSNWATKPATMIRKVALVQALREAFPKELENLYDADELGVPNPEHKSNMYAPIDIPQSAVPQATIEPSEQPEPQPDETEVKPDKTAADGFFNQ